MARFLVPVLAGSISLGLLVMGCGGGSPLLHGAHALNPGQASFGAGFSGTFTAGSARDAVNATAEPGSSSANRTANVAKEGAVKAAMAPAVAPWVGARIGLKGDNEAGLAFTGRAMRLDARHVFESGELAFSIGAGGNAVWRNSDPVSEGSGTMFQVRSGYGFDVPLLVGWRSKAGVVSLWAGPRGGMETIGAQVTQPGGVALPDVVTDVDLLRRYVGGVVGMAMGFRHVHVALELDVFYQAVSGKLLDMNVEVDGLTLSPAGGLLFTF